MDISLHAGFSGVVQLIDVGVVFPFAVSNVAAASAAAGGATAGLEETKRRKYAPALTRSSMECSHAFTPIICDSFGAWNAAAQPVLAAIAEAYAARIQGGRHLGRRAFYAALNATVVRGSARQVLRQAGAHLQE